MFLCNISTGHKWFMEKTQKPVYGISTAAQYKQSTKKKYNVKNILT